MARTYSDASGLPNWLAVALGAIFCLLVLYYSRKILMEIFGEWRNGICSLGEMATISKSETPGLFFVAATFKTVINWVRCLCRHYRGTWTLILGSSVIFAPITWKIRSDETL